MKLIKLNEYNLCMDGSDVLWAIHNLRTLERLYPVRFDRTTGEWNRLSRVKYSTLKSGMLRGTHALMPEEKING